MQLENKVALVTGAAQGIGYAIALKFAQEGAKIAVIDIKDAANLVKKIIGIGGSVLSFKADVADEAAVKHAINDIVKNWGKIDILVNNAGIYPLERITDISLSLFKKVMDINVIGTFICTQQVAKVLIEKKMPGTIINIASAAGIDPEKYHSHYAASKAAVIALSKAAALELGTSGITVNVIAPGAIETEGVMDPGLFPESQNIPEDFQDTQIKKGGLLGVMGSPDDIANMALYLASEKAKYITGAVISVDGGRVLL
jgi:NAD(P)-dependent dehydrogenase (short-subunit alcohol dehydrogenase family)